MEANVRLLSHTPTLVATLDKDSYSFIRGEDLFSLKIARKTIICVNNCYLKWTKQAEIWRSRVADLTGESKIIPRRASLAFIAEGGLPNLGFGILP